VWRNAVYERDNFTCAKCHVRGGELHPHHINNFAEHEDLRFELDNGITLCVSCHRRFHKLYGRVKNDRLQLDSYLQLPEVNGGRFALPSPAEEE
jgi:5-methylcytosine-specific restriction endonuclease McrA